MRHIVEFDPATGEMVRDYGGQGYTEGSSWTRGQTWALYGFTLSFLHTGNREFLDAAERVANYLSQTFPKTASFRWTSGSRRTCSGRIPPPPQSRPVP